MIHNIKDFLFRLRLRRGFHLYIEMGIIYVMVAHFENDVFAANQRITPVTDVGNAMKHFRDCLKYN